jgi:hypothetical protein
MAKSFKLKDFLVCNAASGSIRSRNAGRGAGKAWPQV